MKKKRTSKRPDWIGLSAPLIALEWRWLPLRHYPLKQEAEEGFFWNLRRKSNATI